ncbi:sensor histidine kinase [Agromyces humatus]|uniref:histidine kinase n=1 Tax=Agromyces humatus TaxID=279573 RepID=A0ABN2L0Z8_9MICO|nr:histidine kinase [Agromyces humatus]
MTAPARTPPSPAIARAGSSRPPSLADWVWAAAAAAALLPLTLVEIFAAARLPHDGGWLVATLTLYAVLHVTIALRRRWLRATLAVASVSMFGLVIASLPGMPIDAVLLPSSLCFLVIVFTAAASDDRLADVASIVVGLVGAAMMTAVSVPWAPTAGPGELIALAGFLVASVGAAWALGRYRRESRRKLAAQEVAREQAAEIRLQADRAAVADERRRIGRELHDVISHSLAVMVAQAEAARVLQGRDDARSRAAVVQVVETGRAAMTDMRGLLGVLAEPTAVRATASAHAPVPPPREPSPGLDDVAALVERAAGPHRSVVLSSSGAQGPVSPGVALAAYRVIQESLTNTLRHTRPPTSSAVRLTWGDDELTVAVTDDGVPTVPDAASHPGGAGRGIRGMHDRVEHVGGRFESRPREGGGWLTIATFPLTPEESRD